MRAGSHSSLLTLNSLNGMASKYDSIIDLSIDESQILKSVAANADMGFDLLQVQKEELKRYSSIKSDNHLAQMLQEKEKEDIRRFESHQAVLKERQRKNRQEFLSVKAAHDIARAANAPALSLKDKARKLSRNENEHMDLPLKGNSPMAVETHPIKKETPRAIQNLPKKQPFSPNLKEVRPLDRKTFSEKGKGPVVSSEHRASPKLTDPLGRMINHFSGSISFPVASSSNSPTNQFDTEDLSTSITSLDNDKVCTAVQLNKLSAY